MISDFKLPIKTRDFSDFQECCDLTYFIDKISIYKDSYYLPIKDSAMYAFIEGFESDVKAEVIYSPLDERVYINIEWYFANIDKMIEVEIYGSTTKNILNNAENKITDIIKKYEKYKSLRKQIKNDFIHEKKCDIYIGKECSCIWNSKHMPFYIKDILRDEVGIYNHLRWGDYEIPENKQTEEFKKALKEHNSK